MLRNKTPKRGGGDRNTKGRKKTVTNDQLGLRDLTKKRYLNDIFQWCADHCDGWMVLIVDKKSMRALSSSLGMYDIMERRITLVEDIERTRAPFTDQGAIYLLAPTEDSVDRLVADWEGKSKKPLYGDSVFIFFLGRIPDNCIEKIKACRPLVKRVKCLSEANIDFLAKELRAFHFDMRKSFQDVYIRKGRNKIESRMAEKLISVCSTLNEYPYIRYANSSPTATVLAKNLDLKLHQFLENPDFWFHGDAKHSDRERATLLILDRKDDCLTPLMHDFHYQAMVTDVLNVKDDMITLVNKSAEDYEEFEDDVDDDDYDGNKKEKSQTGNSSKNAKDILLNENDSVWVELRGKHIAEVINVLSERCQEMVGSDTSGLAGRGSGGEAMSMSQMASALKALPEYQQVMEKLSHHMQLAHHCMDKLNMLGLMGLSEVEQTLATGETEEGATPDTPELMGLVIQKLNSLADSRARFRLLLITIMSQNGVKEEFKETLWEAALLTKDQEKVLEIMSDAMDIPLINTIDQPKKGLKKLFGNKKKSTADSESEYANTRYAPPMKYILDDLANHRLSIADYPATRELPESHGSGTTSARRSAGSARPKGHATSRWNKTKQDDAAESYQGGRIIVFVIGGISFSELRVAREVMKKENKEVIAGSTYFTSSAEFIDDIRRLAKHSKHSRSHSPGAAEAEPSSAKPKRKEKRGKKH